MKKIITTILSLLIIFAMTGCVSTAKSDGDEDNNKPIAEEGNKETPPVTIEELP